MLNIQVKTTFPRINPTVLNTESVKLADRMAAIIVNEFKLSLISYGKIATGKTLQSVKAEFILDSPSRGYYVRHVVADKVWEFIQQGRKAGSKLPPEKALVEWFRANNIPQKAWFPIRLSIARRGIKSRDVQGRALKRSLPAISRAVENASREISKNLLTNA